MAFFVPFSNFNLAEITEHIGNALQQQEVSLNSELTKLRNNPNPSQQDLVAFQAQLQLWSSLIQMESSIVKIYGDTMKQVVTNVGS